MKKTAKNVLGLFFCILMISMCTGTIPAFAASSGMIHIQLEDLDSDSSDKLCRNRRGLWRAGI